MKIQKALCLCMLLIVMQFSVFAQQSLPQTSDGDLTTVPIFNLVNKADSGYSKVYKVPYNVTQLIFEAAADTITSADSLIIIMQGSPTGKTEGPWFNYGVWRTGLSGDTYRFVINPADHFFRGLYQCKGSAIQNDFRCYITPKK